MRDGRAGLGHPPWQGGGVGGQAEACLQGERPEAGQPRRIFSTGANPNGRLSGWLRV